MLKATTGSVGLILVLCAAAPATAPPPATAPTSGHPSATADPGVQVPVRVQLLTPPTPHHPAHRRVHHRHYVRLPANPAIGEIRSQIAQTVGLMSQLDENVRTQLSQARSDNAGMLVALDAQGNQVGLVAQRIDGLDGRLATETRDRRQDAAITQTRLAQYESRLDGQEQRLAEMSLARTSLPLYVAGGLALAGVLLGLVALFLAFRQRVLAVSEAEGHADRLFRTYRLEFENLLQAAREIEERLAPGKPLKQVREPEMHFRSDGTAVIR